MNTRIFTLLIAFLAIAGNAVWGQGTTTTPETETIDGKTFYLLDSKEDLEWFRDYVNEGNPSACAKLTDNITLDSSEEWTPIMYEKNGTTYSYTGIFDGDGHTISGLNINSFLFSGLFGVVGSVTLGGPGGTVGIIIITEIDRNGVVKNLTVEGKAATGSGGIAGINAATIQDCTNKVSFTKSSGISIIGDDNTGGICSQNYGIIRECTNEGSIETTSIAGGICGTNYGTIEKCCNEGDITGNGTEVGGIAGIISVASNSTSSINNCYNAGDISSEEGTVAGICTTSETYMLDSSIKNCHNYGNLSAKNISGICNCDIPNDPNAELTLQNNYYLENVAITETIEGAEPKSAEAFANGEVLYLLNNPDVWEQTIGTDKYPVFEASSTSSTVCQVTVTPNDASMGTAAGSGYYVAETEITVTATANEGYKFVNWTSGDEEQSTEASYTFTVTSDVTLTANFQKAETPTDPDEEDEGDDIHHPQRPIKYYNIYVDTICPGLDVETSKDVVAEGHQVSAYLTIQAECDTTGMRFEYKRGLFGYWQDLKPYEGVQPGEYIIPNIYTDIYIRALDATLPEEEPTGLDDLEGIQAYAKEGSIYVYTPNREEVTIVSMSGAILKHEEQVGWQSYAVNRGIYIVRIGDKVFKLKN